MPLTDVAIRNANPREKPYKMGDALGLFLLVQPTGAKLWRLKYRIHGREKKVALGKYPEIGVNGTVKIPGSGKVKFPTLRFGFSGGLCGASIFGWASAASRLDGRGWRNQGVGPDVLGQQIGMPAQAVT